MDNLSINVSFFGHFLFHLSLNGKILHHFWNVKTCILFLLRNFFLSNIFDYGLVFELVLEGWV